MEQHFIKYDGKEYLVAEPTIMVWNKLSGAQTLQDEEAFRYTLISTATGLDEEQIKQADWLDVFKVSEYLTDYYMVQSPRFYNHFIFNETLYKFIDLENLTFGEFIDIDGFLSQPTSYRIGNMNMLMALLYRETDENGKVLKYDGSKVADRAQAFKLLPAKYLQGAIFFFGTLENILSVLMKQSLIQRKLRLMKLKIKEKMINLLSSVGVGIQQLFTWLKRTSIKLRGLPKNP
jgi:hypothetical protein